MKGRVLVLLLGLAVCGCANTRGSWSCGTERGLPCRSIAELDAGEPRGAESPPGADGARVQRWWSTGDAVVGAFDSAPRREPDQVVRVLVAGWTDASGDYHAPAEVYAVMRRGGWRAGPDVTPLTLPKPARARPADAAPATPPPDATAAVVGAPSPETPR